jgi:subtilisin family serine protease
VVAGGARGTGKGGVVAGGGGGTGVCPSFPSGFVGIGKGSHGCAGGGDGSTYVPPTLGGCWGRLPCHTNRSVPVWPPVTVSVFPPLWNIGPPQPVAVSKQPAEPSTGRSVSVPPPILQPQQPPVFPQHWRIASPPQPPGATGAGRPPPNPVRPPSGVPAEKEDRFVRDEVLVEFGPGVSPQTADDIAKREQLRLITSQRLELIQATVNRYQIPPGHSVPEVVAALQTDPSIISTQPNYLYSLQENKDGGSTRSPYPGSKMHLDEAHAISEGRNALIGVIDTVIDPDHPEISGSIVDSFDVISADPEPDVKGTETYENSLLSTPRESAAEPDAHGTAIAGVIASHAELTGVAPKARILGVRAFGLRSDRLGAQGTTHNIVTGVEWAIQQHAQVINLSFGGPRDNLLARIIGEGTRHDVIFVASVGNRGKAEQPLYPALDENVIAVTASDERDGVFKNANHCALACIAAPGVGLRVAAPAREYRIGSGTSLASAQVTGVVALLLDERADLAPKQVREVLFNAAKQLSPDDPDEKLIVGAVDAYEALEAARDAPTNRLPMFALQ